jgi:hypothetical protein
MSSEVEVGDLTLRIPGLDARSARWVGEEVSRRLARELAEQRGLRSMRELDVRIEASSVRDLPRLADDIACAILEQLCR